jgi:hypothetical protein
MKISLLDNVHLGKKIRLYRNLHHPIKGRFSVQGCDEDNKVRVLGYVDRALIRDVTFYVSQTSRERALTKGKNGKRSVHAWATGYLITEEFDITLLPPLVEIAYDWRRHTSFVEKETERAIARADFLVVDVVDVVDDEGNVVDESKVFVTSDDVISPCYPNQLSLFG